MKLRQCKVPFFAFAILLLLFLGFLSNLIWSSQVKRNSVVRAFETMNSNHTKRDVVKELGAPDEIEFCGNSDSTDVIGRECAEQFWYKVFISRWGFTFDNTGKVIHKTHNVSY